MSYFSVPTSGWRCLRLTLAVSASTLFAGFGYAQHGHAAASAPAATPPPTVAAAVSAAPAPLSFDSVLSRYKPMTEQKLGSWRAANDTVGGIGGWKAYLKESQTPDVPPADSATAPAAPALKPTTANPHAGHGAKP